MPPLALFVLIWGWVDQKNEAMGLLRGLVRGLSGKVTGTHGLERRELIQAAHSTIVVAAFLEVLTEELGPRRKLTKHDQEHITTVTTQPAVEYLYRAMIPAPLAAQGFDEQLNQVKLWTLVAADHTGKFFSGLPDQDKPVLDDEFLVRVLGRYESRYLELAAAVPEFLIWAGLNEHAATRSVINGLHDSVRTAFETQGDALARLEALLSLPRTGEAPSPDLIALHRANQGVLTRPFVPTTERGDLEVTFPTIERIFVTPRYQITQHQATSRLADENWWDEQPVWHELDLMLAAYLTTRAATQAPMLLLGHPGAGKSLLTKVLAARLPAAEYTVVRVSLRDVQAGAPIINQVQEALDHATNHRVRWTDLVDQSADMVRVVLLDGLDELLQATPHDRSGYLQEVERFQEVEAAQERPVAVIVTSRTIVADRVIVPEGAVVVKLEQFDKRQIGSWLERWRTANEAAISSGAIGELKLDGALQHPHIAGQPLLLLMLALYAADPTSPRLDEDLSTAALYERIFDSFARREVLKHAEHPPHGDALTKAVEDQIERLSIAALAMFNRGSQHVSEADLEADLRHLCADRAVAGERVLGEFFFVHAPEAIERVKVRSYEFLHATFGEYLVARYVVHELRRVALAARYNRDGANDDRLFALLSHQVWALRTEIALFAHHILQTLPGELGLLRTILAELARTFRARRRFSTLEAYRPTPVDTVRAQAVYSANLVLLATAGARQSPQEILGDTPDEALSAWRSAIALWRTLEVGEWSTIVIALMVSTSHGQHGGLISFGDDSAEYYAAVLAQDVVLAGRHAYALGFGGEITLFHPNTREFVLGQISGRLLGKHAVVDLLGPADQVGVEGLADIAEALRLLLRVRFDDLTPEEAEEYRAFIVKYGGATSGA
ncbi:AAA family ATPase [Actinokineospora sp. NBRC 105648]|uniref:NACHT domain-containing protein n=1 Tax=Actinokineospora sp. NBRC 105648 TaxID=3032206 RepID=UPI002554AF22|nr:AAA family ATPase [Actinokineospora sp. NBRC 105648]